MPASRAAPRATDPVLEACQWLAHAPQTVAVVDGVRRMTRGAWLHEAQRVGSALRQSGLGPGAAVAFQLPNWHEACVIHLAAVLYGYRLVPLLPMYREAELQLILNECAVEAIFLPERWRQTAYAELFSRVQPQRIPNSQVFVVRGTDVRYARYADLLAARTPTEPATPAPGDEVKMVLYTSGSTGKPKGVLHTHRSMAELIDFAADFWSLTERDVALVPSPVGHIGGSMYAFEFPLRLGMRAVLMDTWNADTAIDLIQAEGVTFCAGATPFLNDLLKAAQQRGSGLPSLRRFVCGGASVPPGLIEQASRQFAHCTVSRAYGSTEVPIICPGIRSRDDMPYGASTDGECAAELQLLGDDDQPVPEGAVGEIVARAPRMFAGYLNPLDNQGAYTHDGYFRMGDLGCKVAGKYLEIKGRKKDIIIRLGENISPLEVENVLQQHAAVRQVAIVGVPDARTGEAAAAFVVLAPGAAFSLAEMQRFLAERGLAKPKWPEHLRIVPSLPTNAVGKVLKRDLQQIYRADSPAA